jgi:hypothetical protein
MAHRLVHLYLILEKAAAKRSEKEKPLDYDANN